MKRITLLIALVAVVVVGAAQNKRQKMWTDTIYEEFPIILKTGKEILFRTGTPLGFNNRKYYYGEVSLSRQEYRELLSYEPSALKAYNAYIAYEVLGDIFGIPLCVGTVYTYYLLIDGYKSGLLYDDKYTEEEKKQFGKQMIMPLAIGLVSGLIMVPFFNTATKKLEKANTLFNQGCAWTLQRKSVAELSFEPTIGGFGLTLTF